MQKPATLPEPWYTSPGVQVYDQGQEFADLVAMVDAKVEEAVAFDPCGQRLPIRHSIALQNLLGEKAVFLLRKHDPAYNRATRIAARFRRTPTFPALS